MFVFRLNYTYTILFVSRAKFCIRVVIPQRGTKVRKKATWEGRFKTQIRAFETGQTVLDFEEHVLLVLPCGNNLRTQKTLEET